MDNELLFDILDDDGLWERMGSCHLYADYGLDSDKLRELIRWFLAEQDRRDQDFIKVMDERDSARREIADLKAQIANMEKCIDSMSKSE